MVSQEETLYREARRSLHITHVAATAVIEQEFAKVEKPNPLDDDRLLKDSINASQLAEDIKSGTVNGTAIINAGQALALALLAQEKLLNAGSEYVSSDVYEETAVQKWHSRRGH